MIKYNKEETNKQKKDPKCYWKILIYKNEVEDKRTEERREENTLQFIFTILPVIQITPAFIWLRET
jgi:hypothetical protein